MDKVYKTDIPAHRRRLDILKREFRTVAAPTDWIRLRIEPLLSHVAALERAVRSPRFAREKTRLRRGVAMFHSDLVYLRTNIKALSEILAVEKRRVMEAASPSRVRRGVDPRGNEAGARRTGRNAARG